MSQSFPENSTRAQIRDVQGERLRTLLAEINGPNPFWTRKFAAAGVDPFNVQSVEDLPRLPLTTKAELVADHRAHQPYSSNLTCDVSRYSRLHQTSGTTGTPLRWLDTPASWNWFMECWAQIYRMVGLHADDRLAFPFSFGPFVGFWAAFDGAARLGNLCLAGGGMSSAARLQQIADNSATVVCCTPTYALRLADVAAEAGIDLAAGSVRALIVAGEPGGGIPATRARIETAWGARLFDHWGMTEIGSLAVECVENPGGLHMLETECIAEVLDPHTLEPVAAGDEGELVITNLGRSGSPLIRYRTGDRVRMPAARSRTPGADASGSPPSSTHDDPADCPCGRQLLRLEGGILGRTDDMLMIRGNNVFPSSMEAILREFAEIVEYRIEVHSERSMQQLSVQIEPTPGVWESASQRDLLMETVARTIKDRLNFQPQIAVVEPISLPRFELKGRRFIREQN